MNKALEGSIRKLLLIFFCFLGFASFSPATAQEFPTGNFKGTGFSVEKNNQVVFESQQLFLFDANLDIKRVSSDMITMTLEVRLKPKANSSEINRMRQDKYRVSWVTKSAGRLICINRNAKCEDGDFFINGDAIEIKAWVSRHNVLETHHYERRQ